MSQWIVTIGNPNPTEIIGPFTYRENAERFAKRLDTRAEQLGMERFKCNVRALTPADDDIPNLETIIRNNTY